MKIFLDADGVLVDFHAAACKRFGCKPMPHGETELIKWIGMDPKAFWASVDCVDFWSELELLPDGMEIFNLARELVGDDNVSILTSPSMGRNVPTGKMIGLRRLFPSLAKRIFIGNDKEMLAHAGVILWDDWEKNITAWIKAGGKAVQVPRPWNNGCGVAESASEYLRYWTSRILRGDRTLLDEFEVNRP